MAVSPHMVYANTVFILLLLASALLVVLGWRHWRLQPARISNWRKVAILAALLATSGAWFLLASLQLPQPYLTAAYGQQIVTRLYRLALPFGTTLAVLAVPFALFGYGRARLYAVAGSLCICLYWYSVALMAAG